MGIGMNHFKLRLVCATVAAMSLTCAGAPETVADSQIEELAKRAGISVLADATSDQDVLDYTKARIPFAKMSPAAQQRAQLILSDISQFRRMPSLQYEVDAGIYRYLVNHPDVSVSTWRAMGISTLKMWQTDRFEFEAEATDGSEGIADVLWRDGNQCLFIVEGRYSSPILPAAIKASALVWLQYRFVNGPNGRYVVNQQVETFVHFPSAAIDAIAKLATRVTNSILDRNVFEVSLYARMMSQAAEKDPDWIAQLAQQLDGVPPERRAELLQVAQRGNGAKLNSSALIDSADGRSEKGFATLGQFKSFEASFYPSNAFRKANTAKPLLLCHDPVEVDNEMVSRAPERVNSTADVAAAANPASKRVVAEYIFYSASSATEFTAVSAEEFPLAPQVQTPTRAIVGAPTAFPSPAVPGGHELKLQMFGKASSNAVTESRSITLPMVELPPVVESRQGHRKDDSLPWPATLKTDSLTKDVTSSKSEAIVKDTALLPGAK